MCILYSTYRNDTGTLGEALLLFMVSLLSSIVNHAMCMCRISDRASIPYLDAATVVQVFRILSLRWRYRVITSIPI